MFQVWRSAVELNAPPQWRICDKKLRERENWPFLHEEKRVLGGGAGVERVKVSLFLLLYGQERDIKTFCSSDPIFSGRGEKGLP